MEIQFNDYNAYPDSNIVSVTDKSITLSTGQFIDFADCAANFHSIHGGSGKCVGQRDVSGSDPSIAFYTVPLTTHIVFPKRGLFRPSAVSRFHTLCRQIVEAGYTTYDGS